MISSALLKLLSSGTISAFRKFGKTADCNKSLSCTDSCTFISYCFCRSLVVVLLQISDLLLSVTGKQRTLLQSGSKNESHLKWMGSA